MSRLSGARRLVERRKWHLGMGALATGLALAAAPVPITLLAAGLTAAVLALVGSAAVGLVAAALLVGGFSIGDARLGAIDAPAGRIRDGQALGIRVHLVTRPRLSPFGSSAEVRVLGGRAQGALLLARAPHWVHWPAHATPGAELALRGTVRRPRSRPGERFDFPAYMRRHGVAGELALERVRSTGARRGGVQGRLDAARRRAERAVASGLPPPEAAVARGMILGQDEAIAESVRKDFRASGLAHLLAVSGQNVMLLAALAVPLLAAAGLGPRPRALALLGLIAIYVPLAGAGPSLQRAAVMGAAGVVALAASRPASRAYALLLAGAVTLGVNPRACGDPGWQLSFAAVAGILWLSPPLRRVLRGIPRPLAEGIAITVAATVATAPLLAHHFDAVPLAGLPANLVALPVVAPIMWLGMVKAALGQLAALDPSFASGGAALAELLGLAAAPLVAYLDWLAERFAELPGAQLALPLGSAPALIAAYAALLATAILARRAARGLEPAAQTAAAAWRRLPASRRGAVIGLLTAAIGLMAVRALAPPAMPEHLTVSFLDVGQGDATLVQHPDGTAVLFDGGPPEAGIARLLRRAGVRRLSVLVATHASRDHHGGLREVIERYPVDLLLDGGDGTRDRAFRSVIAAAERRGVRTARATAPLALHAGGLAIRVLSPRPRAPGPPPDDPNPRAVIAIVRSEGFDLLLSADAESEALAPLSLPDVDAMKVPHHGSSDEGLPEVLDRLKPELAAIEVGMSNTYGHPSPSTLAALRAARVRTYRTDRDGTVRLIVHGGVLQARTER